MFGNRNSRARRGTKGSGSEVLEWSASLCKRVLGCVLTAPSKFLLTYVVEKPLWLVVELDVAIVMRAMRSALIWVIAFGGGHCAGTGTCTLKWV